MTPNAREFRRLRKEAGLSQKQLAELTGLDERTISWIEDEQRPMKRERYVLETVARVLGEVLGRPITLDDITLPDPDDAPVVPENLWKRVVLCIAAAGPPPDGLPSILGVDTVQMVLAGGYPIIFWQLANAHRLGIKYVKVAVRKLGTSAEAYVAYATFQFPGLEIEFFTPDDVNRGPGYTVTTLLRRAFALPDIDAALVVLGDTAFEFKPTSDGGQTPRPERACVLWSAPPNSHRWATTFGGLKPGGRGGRPVFAEHGGGREALIGVYYLNDLNTVVDCAEKLAAVPGAKEIQVTDLLNELTNCHYSIDLIQAGQWYDVGHEDMRFKAHQDLLQRGSSPRVLHKLTFNTGSGVVRKALNIPDPPRCEALIEQIHYLAHLPKCYVPYFPQLLDYNDQWPGVDAGDSHNYNVNGPWYQQANIPFPSAAQLYVFGQLHPA